MVFVTLNRGFSYPRMEVPGPATNDVTAMAAAPKRLPPLPLRRGTGVVLVIDQNTDSSISMIALSADSTILRREVSSGRTFLAKNDAVTTLPS